VLDVPARDALGLVPRLAHDRLARGIEASGERGALDDARDRPIREGSLRDVSVLVEGRKDERAANSSPLPIGTHGEIVDEELGLGRAGHRQRVRREAAHDLLPVERGHRPEVGAREQSDDVGGTEIGHSLVKDARHHREGVSREVLVSAFESSDLHVRAHSSGVRPENEARGDPSAVSSDEQTYENQQLTRTVEARPASTSLGPTPTASNDLLPRPAHPSRRCAWRPQGLTRVLEHGHLEADAVSSLPRTRRLLGARPASCPRGSFCSDLVSCEANRSGGGVGRRGA
jgi:hypothetical protein